MRKRHHDGVEQEAGAGADGHPGRQAPSSREIAAHLLERGVGLRVMQERLGHKRPRTTARDTHLAPPTMDVVHATISALMADL